MKTVQFKYSEDQLRIIDQYTDDLNSIERIPYNSIGIDYDRFHVIHLFDDPNYYHLIPKQKA